MSQLGGFMRVIRSFWLLVFLFVLGCSSEGPVSLPIPFEAGLDNSSRVVVGEGLPGASAVSALQGDPLTAVSLQPCPENAFALFNSDGSFAGCETLGTMSVVSSQDVGGQRQDELSGTVQMSLGSEGSVGGPVTCYDYPHDDPTITCSDGELTQGVCSGIPNNGDGIFINAPGKVTMDNRYVACTKNLNGRKAFSTLLDSVWVLHGATDVVVQGGDQKSDIITTLFENDLSFPVEGGGLAFNLYREGDSINPSGFVKYTDANFLTTNPQFVEALFTVELCQGTGCDCSGGSCTCQGESSCVKIHNARYLTFAIPQIADLFTEGIPFSSTMTEQDPTNCEEVTGVFKPLCDAGTLKLDYRCQPILGFDEDNIFVGIIRSLSGAYVIKAGTN